MKGKSEPKFREALGDVELNLLIYKPPDDARNWKPCDFMVWWRGDALVDYRREVGPGAVNAAWFEVKESRSGTTFPVAKELRPSQRGGIRDAAAIGLPYWLAIWWPERSTWTISRALPLLEVEGSLGFSELAGKHGVDAPQHALAGTLRMILEGEL